jgi:hypothetical protein
LYGPGRGTRWIIGAGKNGYWLDFVSSRDFIARKS